MAKREPGEIERLRGLLRDVVDNYGKIEPLDMNLDADREFDLTIQVVRRVLGVCLTEQLARKYDMPREPQEIRRQRMLDNAGIEEALDGAA